MCVLLECCTEVSWLSTYTSLSTCFLHHDMSRPMTTTCYDTTCLVSLGSPTMKPRDLTWRFPNTSSTKKSSTRHELSWCRDTTFHDVTCNKQHMSRHDMSFPLMSNENIFPITETIFCKRGLYPVHTILQAAHVTTRYIISTQVKCRHTGWFHPPHVHRNTTCFPVENRHKFFCFHAENMIQIFGASGIIMSCFRHRDVMLRGCCVIPIEWVTRRRIAIIV